MWHVTIALSNAQNSVSSHFLRNLDRGGLGILGDDVVELREESILQGLGVQMLTIKRIDEHNH